MAKYITLAPVTYLDGGVVREVVRAGVIIDLDATQAAALAGSVQYVSFSTPFVDPSLSAVGYDTFTAFPSTGDEQHLYLDKTGLTLYKWSNASQVYIALHAGLTPKLYFVDDYGADPTGAAFSDTAVDAAITAMGINPGSLMFGAGIYKLNTTKTLSRPGQGMKGLNVGATIIDYRGTGDCFRVWDSTVPTNGLTLPGNSAPITGMTLYGWNNANTNICGLHIGDLGHIFIEDFYITGFQTSGSKNFWGENRYSWSERGYIRLEAGWSPDNFLFETNAAHPLGHSSWSYCTFELIVSADVNQNGLRLKNNVKMIGVDGYLRGNCFVHPSANTGVAITVGTTGGDTSVIDGPFVANLEAIGTGTIAHKDINVGAAGQIVGAKELVFHDYAAAFVSGTATPATVQAAGRIDCPSLGHMAAGQAFAVTEYASLKAALTPSEVPVPPVLFDAFTAADGTVFDSTKWTVTTGGAVAAAAATNGNRGRLTTGATGGYSGTDKVFAVSTFTASLIDTEILLRHTFGAVANESYTRYAVRASATDPQSGSNYCLRVDNANVQFQKHVSGVETGLATFAINTLGMATPTNGAMIWIRMRAKGTTVAFKAWTDGTPEPVAWTYTTTDSAVSAGGSVVAATSGGSAAVSGVNYVDQFHIYAL